LIPVASSENAVILRAAQPGVRAHFTEARAKIGRLGAARTACPESLEGDLGAGTPETSVRF
jgi:hypothetical protein